VVEGGRGGGGGDVRFNVGGREEGRMRYKGAGGGWNMNKGGRKRREGGGVERKW